MGPGSFEVVEGALASTSLSKVSLLKPLFRYEKSPKEPDLYPMEILMRGK